APHGSVAWKSPPRTTGGFGRCAGITITPIPGARSGTRTRSRRSRPRSRRQPARYGHRAEARRLLRDPALQDLRQLGGVDVLPAHDADHIAAACLPAIAAATPDAPVAFQHSGRVTSMHPRLEGEV